MANHFPAFPDDLQVSVLTYTVEISTSVLTEMTFAFTTYTMSPQFELTYTFVSGIPDNIVFDYSKFDQATEEAYLFEFILGICQFLATRNGTSVDDMISQVSITRTYLWTDAATIIATGSNGTYSTQDTLPFTPSTGS